MFFNCARVTYFHGQNKSKIRVSAICSVHTKKLIDIEGKKNINFGIKIYIFSFKVG